MHRRLHRLGVAAALTTLALVLSACGGPGTGTTPDPSTPPSEASSLTVGLVLPPTNLDIRHTDGAALEQVLIDNVYEGLVTRGGTEIVPRLASEWDISADGLEYTFTLQSGVTFHNGEAMTSADVVASMEAVRTDESLQGHGDLAGVASITAPDAQTVVITLTEPNLDFLFLLTGRAGLVLQDGDTTDLKTAENGTGPFSLTRWAQGSTLTFGRYDGYWGEPAGLSEVVFSYIDDGTARINAALDGSLDVLTEVDPTLLPQLEATGDFTFTYGRTTNTATLAFNNARAPLNDVRVREALRLAIDHDALVEALGGGDTLYGPIPELDPGYEDLSALAPYDPARAMELLAEAGQENLELTLTIPNFYSTTIARVLVSDFAKVGVTLDVNVVEFATWLEDVYTNKDYELSFVYHAESRDFGNYANPDYYFGYDNAQVQALYAESLRQTDPDAAAKLLAEAARIVSADHAADWLFNAVTITALRPGVSGFPEDLVSLRLDMSRVTATE